jgi:hypothetical protein
MSRNHGAVTKTGMPRWAGYLVGYEEFAATTGRKKKLQNMYFCVGSLGILPYPRESAKIRGELSYFNSSTSFSLPLLISSIFLISPSVSF